MHYTLTQHFFIFGAEYAFVLVALVGFVIFWRMKGAKKERFVIFALISIPIMYIVAEVAGFLYYDARPFVSDSITSLVYHAADNGFPSGHTLFCAAIAAVCTPYSKRWSIVLWILTVWVGVSRVYVGVHHWIDIVGSIVIAVAIAFAVYHSGWIEKVLHAVKRSTRAGVKPPDLG